MGGDIRTLRQQLMVLVAPAAPFVVQGTVSAGTFTLGLYAAQAAGYFCRVSSATPVIGSAFGMAGVALASIAAGQASIQCHRYYRGLPFSLGLRGANQQHLVLDAIIGMSMWKVLGGRFRNVMPSDLFAPGSMAVMSLPSAGARYAGEASRDKLRQMYRRYGCHHCGSRRGPVIGDHIPPNRQVWGSTAELVPPKLRKVAESLGYKRPAASKRRPARNRASKSPLAQLISKAQKALLIQKQMPQQRYYPQCVSCSQKQSAAVRSGRRKLIMHYSLPRKSALAGAFVGLRYYVGGPPQSRGDSDRHSRRWDSPNPWPNKSVDAFGLRLQAVRQAFADRLGGLVTDAGLWLSLRHQYQWSGQKLVLQILTAN